jgi:hypothetical protein
MRTESDAKIGKKLHGKQEVSYSHGERGGICFIGSAIWL